MAQNERAALCAKDASRWFDGHCVIVVTGDARTIARRCALPGALLAQLLYEGGDRRPAILLGGKLRRAQLLPCVSFGLRHLEVADCNPLRDLPDQLLRPGSVGHWLPVGLDCRAIR